MRQGKNSFRHESLQDSASIRRILESITNGIAKGKLSFSDEDDKILMQPNGLLHLKLTATEEEDRHKINIRISWQAENAAPKKKKALSISTK